jgi:ribosomal protein L17
MKQLASSVRGTVKTIILRGAVSAFKNSRIEATNLRHKINDEINKYVDKTVDLLTKAENEQDAIDKIDKNEPKFRNIFDKFIDMIIKEYNENNTGLVKRNNVGINVNKLETAEERNYAQLADQITEYYVSELLKIRAILSTFQTFLARVIKKTDNNYDAALLKEFPPMFKSYLRGRFNDENTGKYLVAHLDKHYDSTNDKSEEFNKFENLLNNLLGID